MNTKKEIKELVSGLEGTLDAIGVMCNYLAQEQKQEIIYERPQKFKDEFEQHEQGFNTEPWDLYEFENWSGMFLDIEKALDILTNLSKE